MKRSWVEITPLPNNQHSVEYFITDGLETAVYRSYVTDETADEIRAYVAETYGADADVSVIADIDKLDRILTYLLSQGFQAARDFVHYQTSGALCRSYHDAFKLVDGIRYDAICAIK